jgi:hypothetical protein
VSAVTGEGRYILPLWITDASGFHGIFYTMMTFDGTDADTFYGFSTSHARLFKYTYKGDHTEISVQAETSPAVCNNPSNPTNKPCLVITELTAGLSDLADLVHAFDPAFDKTKWVAYPIGTNAYHGAFEILYKRNDGAGGPQNNSYAWIAAFDPTATGNSRPGNAGCVGAALGNGNPGCVIGAIPAYARAPVRGVNTKGSTYSDSDTGVIAFGPHLTCENTAQNGTGCWKSDIGGGFSFSATAGTPGAPVACPSNNFGVTGQNCTQVTVLSEPYDPNPGPGETGAPGEYILAAEGDIFCVNCTTVGGPNAQLFSGTTNVELVRLIVKNGNTWWLQRHFQYGFNDNYICPSGKCGAGSPAALASGANPSLWYSGSGAEVYWDFVHDPTGAALVLDTRELGAHDFMRRGVMVESAVVPNPPCGDTVAGCYMIRYNPAPTTAAAVAAMDPTGFTPTNPAFASKAGVAVINGTQSHPNGPGLSADEPNRAMFYDARPYNGQFTSSSGAPQAANVSGQLWKFAAGAIALNRKFLPTHATNGVHVLTDVSGPGSALGTSAADAYKYCVVLAADECRAGSAAGEIYFNTPQLQYNFCFLPGQATSGADYTDICIHDQSSSDDALVQLTAAGSDPNGVRQRVLTHGFTAPRVNSPFWNMFLTPDSRIGLTRSKFVNGFRSELLSVKMPALNFDSRSRNDFVPLPVSIPASPYGFAEVEWGYAEEGADGVSQFFCTSRRDNCRTGGIPFTYASETQAPTACSGGCTISAPVVGDRTVYYRVLRTDAAGNVVARGETRVGSVQ